MAKFTVVNRTPESVTKSEYVIAQPDFMEQILANAQKAPRKKQTGVNHLREILQSISVKYDPELNAMKVPMVKYQGVPYKDDAELATIVNRILKTEYPKIYERVLEFDIKNRPMNTKLVYYVGDFNSTGPFYKAGLDFIEEKDVEAYLTGKPKKVVGKPAVTKEEADAAGSSD